MAGSNINDIKFDALRTAGYTGASLQDMEYAYYLDTYTTPADFSTLRAQFIADNSIEEWEDEIAFWLAGLGPTYSAEATELFAAMSSQPDDTRKGHIDTMITALDTAGVWDKMDAIWIFAAHDSQAALLNWKVPGGTAASLVNAPTFTTDRGFAGNGTTSYVNSNYNPATFGGVYAQDSACFGFWNRSSGQFSGSIAGWFDGSDGITLAPRDTSDQTQYRVNQATATTSGGGSVTNGSGHWLATRTAASAIAVYRNNVLVNANSQGSSAVNSANLRFGSSTAAGFNTAEFAGGWAGTFLSSGERASFYSAVQAYMTAVGA